MCPIEIGVHHVYTHRSNSELSNQHNLWHARDWQFRETIGFVDMSNAYIPSVMAGFVHRREFLREVLAFLNSPDGDALFVTGPTGSGKTSGILQILGTLNWPTQQVTGNGKMELCDLVGHHALVSEKPVKPHP